MSKVIASNRKAYRDYAILETVEAGIELKGSEVKSLREAKANLNDSFARLERGEVILYNVHISPYEQASYLNVEPTRPRKLLLHKKQIARLMGQVAERGFTLIPLKIYFSDRGFAKVELALCKGKKLYDKRESLKTKEDKRDMERGLRGRDR